MSGGGCSDGVVLLHGIARTSRSLNKIERALQGSRFATLNLDYASRKKPLDMLAADIARDVARFAERIDGSKVSVQRTSLDGMTDHTIVRASHPGLLRHPAAFLRDGRFVPVSA
ncbi:MAG: hypothetical protein ABI192_05320 [Bradyrhizobium sp.]